MTHFGKAFNSSRCTKTI